MSDKISPHRQGVLKFGTREPKEPLYGEVKTYKLSDEELAKIREETGYHVLDLKKETYLDLKAQGKSDRVITNELDISMASLTRYKAKWGLIGQRGRPEATTNPPVDKQAEDESRIEAGVIKTDDLNAITVNSDKFIKADPILGTVPLWIVIYTYETHGADIIRGVYNSGIDAKVAFADLCLQEDIHAGFVGLVEQSVEVKE